MYAPPCHDNAFMLLYMFAKSLQSRPTLCDPMDCRPPGSSVHGILQARILEWVAMPSSGVFQTQGLNPHLLLSLTLAGGFFTTSVTWEVSNYHPIAEIKFFVGLDFFSVNSFKVSSLSHPRNTISVCKNQIQLKILFCPEYLKT